MTKSDKLLARMRANPRDWRIEDLQALAVHYGLTWSQPGTSHVTFRASSGQKLTVPAHKPLKAFYVLRFLDLLEGLQED